jgi:hypothetical protein
VVHQGASQPVRMVVGERAMQEVAAEHDGGAGLELDGDGSVVAVLETVGLGRVVEAGVAATRTCTAQARVTLRPRAAAGGAERLDRVRLDRVRLR